MLLTLLWTLPAAADTVFLVDSPFDQGMVLQPTRIYDLDPATGALTLKADLGATYTAILGLAAASGTELYGIGSDNSAETPCFACVLLHIVLDPASTTPVSLTRIGPLRHQGDLVIAFTQLTFRGNGDLYGVSEETDALYLIDPETADMTEIGPLTVDLGSGCTMTPLDVTGGDLAFDALDRLWLWNNTQGQKGLWEVNPANGCAIQRTSCPGSRNMSGLTVADHTSPSPEFRAPSPNDERLYRVLSNACPSNNESTSLLMRLNGMAFNHDRGDTDSPFCVSDPACDDTDACTADHCSPGGCVYDPVSCDDGDACTDDACDPATGCQHTPHACDDGNACTDDVCDPAVGCQTTPISCDDGNACTDDACDPLTGCQNTPHACDDGSACTADSCDPVVGCQATPISCEDGNACTDDACDPLTGCQRTPIFCDDGNACTANVCDPDSGCTFPPAAGTCDDGIACTENDACDGGTCSGTPVVLFEVPSLSVIRELQGNTRLEWTPPPGSDLTYDLVSGPIAELGGPDVIPTATCLGNGLGLSTYDLRADPLVGEGFYYLVRAENACGRGSYGQASGGQTRRPTNDCP
ncbi:MAG TPA: hypothetical protein VFV75_08805 [Candidatus Polarisedimenticolaceae bacterium]|nr:hypothetical protein [Candidatus Polarisedimenticolaceae bacterium]